MSWIILFGDSLGRRGAFAREPVPVCDAERCPGFGLVEDRVLTCEGRLEIKRDIFPSVVALLVAREGTDVLACEEVGTVAQFDVEQRLRAVTLIGGSSASERRKLVSVDARDRRTTACELRIARHHFGLVPARHAPSRPSGPMWGVGDDTTRSGLHYASEDPMLA